MNIFLSSTVTHSEEESSVYCSNVSHMYCTCVLAVIFNLFLFSSSLIIVLLYSAGIPPPPPLTPDPSSFSQRRNTIDVPRVDPSSGRPFSANDLQHAKTLLKRKEFEEEQPRPKSGGLQNVLSDALDQRLGSIRNAVESDEDTDIEEVDDDDWDD